MITLRVVSCTSSGPHNQPKYKGNKTENGREIENQNGDAFRIEGPCNDHHALYDDKCLDCVSILIFIEHANM